MPYFPRRRDAVATHAARVRSALDTHYDAIWRFLRRLGVVSGDVEDAAQKVFLVFAQRIASIDPKAERSFLFASALRIASDARRRGARSPEMLVDHHETLDAVDPAPGAEEQLDTKRVRRWLDDVLDTLSDEHRAVFVLVDIEEQTMAEVSDVLGIPTGTVASRLRRSRELFEASANALKLKLDEENSR